MGRKIDTSGLVKARGASKMKGSSRKVGFIPTESSARRMAKASHGDHIRSVNNIMRFESTR